MTFSFGTHKMKERHNERKERHSYKYGCTDAHLQQFHQNSAGDHINFCSVLQELISFSP